MDEYKCSFDYNEEFERGTALVISMTKHRAGANEEKDHIINLAESFFKFIIVEYIDRPASYIKKHIGILTGGLDQNADCFVCFVNAHGDTDPNGNGYILDNEGDKLLTFEDIMKPFLESQSLEGKPKVFFLNACRGENERTNCPVQAARSLEKEGKKRMHRTIDLLKNRTDVLAVFSTDVGDKSFRDLKRGANFITVLVRMMTLYNNTHDLLSIFTKVNHELGKEFKPQTIVVENTLTKKLYWRTTKETNDYRMENVPKHQVVPPTILGQTECFNKLKQSLLNAEAQLLCIAARPGPKFSGVVGMGGIGKSTLAKTLFNDRGIQKHYEDHVFWLEVKHQPNIKEKQRELLSEMGIHISTSDLKNTEQLRRIIQKGFRDVSPFLLVLDDVWSMQDIVEMLGNPLASVIPGSCACLITTRDKRELEGLKAKTLELDLLSDDDSRALFCLHAFDDREILKGLNKDLVLIVEETIKACGNLPILLEVLGRERSGKTDKADWMGILNKVKEARVINFTTYDGILKVLQLSYDALNDDLKDMFLDFAYFVEHETIKVKTLAELWPRLVNENKILEMLKELEGKCLVKLSTTKKWYEPQYQMVKWQMVPDGIEDVVECQMHDFLKQLARSILEGMDIASRRHLVAENLHLKNVHMKKRPYEERPYEARTLTLESPCELTLKLLAQVCIKLGMLESLSISSERRTVLPPQIGELKNLQRLDLYECSIPQEIRELQNLQRLYLRGCSIPQEIRELKNLQRLDLNGCDVPQEIRELKNLQKLCLNRCIDELEEIGELQNLQTLILIGNEILTALPRGIKNLNKLQKLDLRGCTGLRKANFTFPLDSFPHLEELSLSDIMFYTLTLQIPNTSCLKSLDLSENWELRELPDNIGRLASLEFLNLFNCLSLSCLPPSITNLRNLRSINLACDSYIPLELRNVQEKLELFQKLKDIRELRKIRIFELQELQEITITETQFALLWNAADKTAKEKIKSMRVIFYKPLDVSYKMSLADLDGPIWTTWTIDLTLKMSCDPSK